MIVTNQIKNAVFFRRAAGLMCLLAGIAQAQTNSITRTSSFEYDADGMLVKEVVEPDSPNDCLQTTYTYNAQGNRSGSSSSTCPGAFGRVLNSAGVARTMVSEYAAQTTTIDGVSYEMPVGMLPTKATNAKGQSETREYDPRFGKPIKLTGPNNGVTQWSYDGFGMKTQERRSDGSYTNWSYKYCQIDGQARDPLCPVSISKDTRTHNIEWYITEINYGSDGVPLTAAKLQFYDELGRVVRSQSQSFAGAAIVQDTFFNALGQTVHKSIAYLLNGGAPLWTSYAYDVLGRPTTQTAPDGDGGEAQTTYSYNGLSLTVTNALSQIKTTIKNAVGLTEKVIDDIGGEVTYAYDALGQLTQTNAAGSITTLNYDLRGRKIGMQDPAMGVWDYEYNAFSELVWQKDSLSHEVSMAYDELGRMTTRTEPDLVSHWYYDYKEGGVTPCGASVGKLCEATADNGYRRTHQYDAIGRLTSTSTVLESAMSPAVISRVYNPTTGRVHKQTWPTGYSVEYDYTAQGPSSAPGYLLRVRGIEDGVQNASMQILSMDEQGNVSSYVMGNSVVTVNDRESFTGKLRGVKATLNGQTDGNVLNHSYGYDALGNMRTRTDVNTGVAESISYDDLNRISMYTALGGGLQTTQQTQVLYDLAGNIKYKSDVGYYHYDAQRPQRLTNITLAPSSGWSAIGDVSVENSGTKALTYAFDDYLPGVRNVGEISNALPMGNGNLMYTVSQDQQGGPHTVRWESYTSFNMPLDMNFGALTQPEDPTAAVADRTLSFVYGPEHQRIRQTVTLTSNAPSHMESGSTWYINGEDGQSLTYEQEVKANGLVEHKHYLNAGGINFALYTKREGVIPQGKLAQAVAYLHHDHLGSVAAVSDGAGAVVERMAYDPWGKRRHTDGQKDSTDALYGQTTDRGYTMHEHLDEMGVIHMNGRVYDPNIGRFMSADPHIQYPDNLQSFNRYSYVLNNPLLYTDPSGFWSWKKLIRTVVAIVVAVVIVVYAAPALFSAMSVSAGAAASIGAKMAVGAVAGGLSSAIQAGTGKAFWRGALTGALFAAAGTVGGTGAEAAASPERLLAHAGAGCISAVAGGENCGRGAASAVVGKFFTVHTEGIGGEGPMGDIAHATMASVSGGLASVAGGGKFGDGASTAAFGYLFNNGLSRFRPNSLSEQILEGGGGAVVSGATKEAGVVANGIRGRASEARVLNETGLTKNTRAVSTAEGQSIPDSLTNSLSVEVKDAANVSLTRQLRIQTEAARSSGRESVLITGEQTCISGACSRAFDTIIRRSDLGPK